MLAERARSLQRADCAGARSARGPSRRALLPCGSQREREHEGVFAPAVRRIVAAAHRDFAKAEARIKALRRLVARTHFQKYIFRAELARKARRFLQERRAVAAPLMPLGDREIEKVRLARRRHQDEIADELAGEPPGAAFVAGAQRIGEVALRPRMAVDRVLDRHHLGEIAFAHRLQLGKILEDCAHCFSSSCLVNATLSLMYTGAASAASTPSPASRRGAASCATAMAVGCTSGSTCFSPKFP